MSAAHPDMVKAMKSWPITFQLGPLLFVHAGFGGQSFTGDCDWLNDPGKCAVQHVLDLISTARATNVNFKTDTIRGIELWNQHFCHTPAVHTLVKGHCPTVLCPTYITADSIIPNGASSLKNNIVMRQIPDTNVCFVMTDVAASASWWQPLQHSTPHTAKPFNDGYGWTDCIPHVGKWLLWGTRCRKWLL